MEAEKHIFHFNAVQHITISDYDLLITWKQQLSDTVSTETDDFKLSKGMIYCRGIILDCIQLQQYNTQ